MSNYNDSLQICRIVYFIPQIKKNRFILHTQEVCWSTKYEEVCNLVLKLKFLGQKKENWRVEILQLEI